MFTVNVTTPELSDKDVDLIVNCILQAGGTLSQIFRVLSDYMEGEAGISIHDGRRRAFENARDALDDAEAEMLSLEEENQ